MNQITPNYITRLAIIISLFFMSSIQAQICRVSTSGTSNASGASWQQTKDLVSALNDSNSCPEIWVKSGTYYPTSTNNRNISFILLPGVEMYGGFYGFETDRAQRDYKYNKPILSGNIGSYNYANDNSYHVIFLDATNGFIGQSTRMDGFIVSDGYASESTGNNSSGGGLYCDAVGDETCNPYLKNMIFINNIAKYGGAIYNNCENNGNSSPILEKIHFIDNRALFGGKGGAIYNNAYGGNCSPVIHNSEFKNNYADEYGGAIFNDSNIYNDDNPMNGLSYPVISSSTFSGNSAKNGGAISSIKYHSDSILKTDILSSTFNQNTAQDNGGAIFTQSAELNLENVTIADNEALISGGGIYTSYSTSNN